MENKKGCCVASSYEAKTFGVKTATSVPKAKRLCHHIQFLPSRHRLYVRYNLRVDEFQLGLSGPQTALRGSRALVERLKAHVAAEVGECLRFSAGIGPNHLLAKIAGKLEKPDGCQWLGPDNMPDRIAHLRLEELPGISNGLAYRLQMANVFTVPQLWALDPRHARAIWNSIEGERFVRALQGMEIPLQHTQRGGYGNSKVLAPDFRAPAEAYLVSRWLIEKAATRLRRDDRVARRFTLQLGIMGGPRHAASMSCPPSQDTATFLQINRSLWREAWPLIRRAKLAMIGVHLSDVDTLAARTGDLLRPLRPGERSAAERVSVAADALNERFGAGTITFGLNKLHPGFFERE